jgi:hypothetical protein
MRLLPWLLSFVFPRCTALGSSGLRAPGLYAHHDFGVNPP